MWGEACVESASGNDTSKQALQGLVHPWSVYASELNHHAAFFGQPVERCFILRSENALRSRIHKMAATHVLVALMTAAATTSGFLAPQLAAQRAMHLPPLQSMAEGEGDWPSDSAEDAAPDVIDVPRVEDRESLKKELLLAVSRTARGQQLDKRPNEAVNDVARRLEAQGAPTDAQLLNGRWNLAYCSTYLFRSSPFWPVWKSNFTARSC